MVHIPYEETVYGPDYMVCMIYFMDFMHLHDGHFWPLLDCVWGLSEKGKSGLLVDATFWPWLAFYLGTFGDLKHLGIPGMYNYILSGA